MASLCIQNWYLVFHAGCLFIDTTKNMLEGLFLYQNIISFHIYIYIYIYIKKTIFVKKGGYTVLGRGGLFVA